MVNSERDENTRPPDLLPEKSVCSSGIEPNGLPIASIDITSLEVDGVTFMGISFDTLLAID